MAVVTGFIIFCVVFFGIALGMGIQKAADKK